MTISINRKTMGVRAMPDDLDSGYCTLCTQLGEVRVNIDGIWFVLCLQHKQALREALDNPEPAPPPKPPPKPRYELVPEDWEEWWDD